MQPKELEFSSRRSNLVICWNQKLKPKTNLHNPEVTISNINNEENKVYCA